MLRRELHADARLALRHHREEEADDVDPLGEERLRVNVTRGHTQEDMDKALDLLKSYGEAFFVLSGEELGPMEDD